MQIGNNYGDMISSTMELNENAKKIADIAIAISDPELGEASGELLEAIAEQIPTMIAYSATAQSIDIQSVIIDNLLDIKV